MGIINKLALITVGMNIVAWVWAWFTFSSRIDWDKVGKPALWEKVLFVIVLLLNLSFVVYFLGGNALE